MPVYALCDANNYYCCCERVFAPHLRGVPVVVLSNNDGCCIADANCEAAGKRPDYRDGGGSLCPRARSAATVQ